MRTSLGPLLVLALASCGTTQQRLSRSIYERGVRASRFEAMGAYDAARLERAAADQERERLARGEHFWGQPNPL